MAEFTLECRACGRRYDGADGLRMYCNGELDDAHGPVPQMRPSESDHVIEVIGEMRPANTARIGNALKSDEVENVA